VWDTLIAPLAGENTLGAGVCVSGGMGFTAAMLYLHFLGKGGCDTEYCAE